METPSGRLIVAAQAAQEVADSRGRTLRIRRLGALDKLRLFKAAGPQLAQNRPWLGMALLACSVSEIDGIPVPQPSSETQIEALVGRLGDEGLSCVAATLGEARAAVSKDMVGN